MKNDPVYAEKAYAQVCREFSGDATVTVGSKGKKGFGSSALRVNDRIFAMVSSSGAFVVKLPMMRVDELIADGKGKRFEPGPGRVMKEWIEVEFSSHAAWLKLAREAQRFVSDGK